MVCRKQGSVSACRLCRILILTKVINQDKPDPLALPFGIKQTLLMDSVQAQLDEMLYIKAVCLIF